MPVSVSVGFGAPSASVGVTSATASGPGANLFITVTNTGSAAVTIQSLVMYESTESDLQISQPTFLTPNAPLGTGAPVLAVGASRGFQAITVFNSPYFSGPSPQAPGGASPSNAAMNADPFFSVTAVCSVSDGTTATGSLPVPVLATIGPATVPTGGAWHFNSGFNLVNGLTLGIY